MENEAKKRANTQQSSKGKQLDTTDRRNSNNKKHMTDNMDISSGEKKDLNMFLKVRQMTN